VKSKSLSVKTKRSLTGYIFLIPWLVGIALFFAYPLINTIIYSFNKFDMHNLQLSYIGFKNFRDAFFVDAEFPVLLTNAIIDCLENVPLIIIFSFFIAMMIRKQFKGDFIIKSIFFITVILYSDVFLIMQAETKAVANANIQNVINDSGNFFTTMDSLSISKYLIALGINPSWIEFVDKAISNISTITLRSGIQIFIFLAGLHSIPDSMYEASNIEGATAWENIWKITLPLMTPVVLVNLIYTIVDSFETLINPLLQYIYKQAFGSYNFGYSAALSIIYFVIILSFLAIVTLYMRKKTYYQG
jgi:ABC-type sugar transport system permease subunit